MNPKLDIPFIKIILHEPQQGLRNMSPTEVLGASVVDTYCIQTTPHSRIQASLEDELNERCIDAQIDLVQTRFHIIYISKAGKGKIE